MAQTLNYLRPLFHEEQDFRGSRAVVYTGGTFVLVAAGLCATMLLMNGPVWPALLPVALAGGIITVVMFLSKMTTIVDAAGVHVRYFPFLNKTFALADVTGWEVKKYDAIEYGGWGVRGLPDRYGWAYIVRGHHGVEIEFKNGHRLMLGSQRAEELARALEEVKRENA